MYIRVQFESSPTELNNSYELQLCNWIEELPYSSILPYCRHVGRIRELFNWIRELSNSITERYKWISTLSNCTHMESSVIELESSVIELESSAIQ